MNRTSEVWIRFLFDDWHKKAQRLLLGIFLYQLIIWFDAYWVNETKPIVVWTLAATFAVEWFGRRPAWLRSCAGFLAAVALTINIIRPVPVNGRLEGATDYLYAVLDYIVKLSPFVWFALGAWIIYVTLEQYLTTKWRLFALLVTGVVLLAIVDSFSTFIFWDQVAIMIVCGLLMLVVHHLHVLKVKDPEGYEHLMNYPVPITVMIITIISAAMALGMLAPNIRPMIMDPYTAWKSYQGESVEAFGKGEGWFSDSNSRNASSGYSRIDTNLGGAFDFDYTPVFTVNTSRRSYWRGETRSYYNGTGWEVTSKELNDYLVPVEGNATAPDSPYGDGKLKTVEITQTFSMSKDTVSFPVLFAAPFAESIAFNEEDRSFRYENRSFWHAESESLIWFDDEGGNIPYPRSYTVVSEMPVIDEAQLRRSPALADAKAWQDYLQLPDSLPERVRKLAAKVTEQANNPYDKAKALQTYLSSSFPYTNAPDVSKGRSADFVDRFLFEIQEGYCDYYSTAMVVMSRSIGLPARWVKGYVPGQSDIEMIYRQYLPGEAMDLNGPGTYTVRNSDAHSWVEVYFEGYGWIPFEPTSGFTLPIVQLENEAEVALPLDLNETAQTLQAETSSVRGGSSWWIASGAAVLAVALFAYLTRRFRWIELMGTRKLRKSPNYNVKFLGEMERLLYRLRRKGLQWSDNETVREMMQRWMKEHAWLQKDLQVLLLAFEKAKYSKAGLSEEEYRNAENRIRKLRESLR
jgi:transglutaminase-like putative cysteine protease